MGAVEIEKLEEVNLNDGMMLHPVFTDIPPFYISREYIDKHNPQVGGYFVEYEGGYLSWSPADVFEDGYERIYGDEIVTPSETDTEESDMAEDPLL